MVTKRQKIVEEMQEKDKERRKKQPKRKYHGRKGHTVPDQESWHHPLPEGYKEGSTKGKKSTVGGGKQGVKTVTPEHMKAPKKKAAAEKKVKKGGEGMGFIKEAAKRTKETKPAPHMVRHTKAPAKAKRAATSFTEKAGVAQDIGPWKPTDRKATKPKVSYKKRKKTPYHIPNRYDIRKKTVDDLVGMKKGGSVDTQWGGYNFKDGGRIPGIRPTRKGT